MAGRVKIQNLAKAVLEREEIPPGKTIIEAKKDRQQPSPQSTIEVSTNVYPVKTTDIPVYRYDMLMTAYYERARGGMGGAVLTKKTIGGDGTMQSLYAKCREVFAIIRAEDPTLKKCRLYYDLQSIMYSLEDLHLSAPLKIQVDGGKLSGEFGKAKHVEVVITPVAEDFQLTLADMSGTSSDLAVEDRSLLQFIDIATSQHIYFDAETHVTLNCHRSYLMDPLQHGYRPADLAEFPDNGAYLGIGAEKAAHWVEGPRQTKCLAMIVESKKTAFHGCETVLDKFKRLVDDVRRLHNGEFFRVNKMFTGLEFETHHLDPSRRFTIKSVADQNARDKIIEVTDNTGAAKSISVEEYYKWKHNITLIEPLALLVNAGRDRFFPMELCQLCDSQRVKTLQQTGRQVQEMIKKCAVPPAQHRDEIARLFRSLHLRESEPLKDARIDVFANPVKLAGRMLQTPQLTYARGSQPRINASSGTWMGSGFHIAAGCTKWAAYALLGQRDRLTLPDFRNFLGMMIREANNRGMKMPPHPYKEPEIMAVNGQTFATIDRCVRAAKEAGCDFFIVVHGDASDDTHAQVKVAEQKYSIVTQEFRVGTVNKTVQRNQVVTMQNVVYKSNVKMGGLNYTLFPGNQTAKHIVGADTLFMGITINHPSGGRKESALASSGGSVAGASGEARSAFHSVVGFAANVGRSDDFEFVGDYLFQEYNGEIHIESVADALRQCLLRHKEGHKRPPARIVIYRNECSEGWFAFILQYEVPLIKKVLQQEGCLNAKVTIIVANKMQGVRFFKTQIDPKARASDQNVSPGLAVDTIIVHPERCEFFLNSHRALQGTAKTPKYTVVLDENKYPLAQLEDITYQLCYGHQIVCMPTSLPSPLYIAIRYAERGRKVYTQRLMQGGQINEEPAALTEELSYRSKSELRMQRINA